MTESGSKIIAKNRSPSNAKWIKIQNFLWIKLPMDQTLFSLLISRFWAQYPIKYVNLGIFNQFFPLNVVKIQVIIRSLQGQNPGFNNEVVEGD